TLPSAPRRAWGGQSRSTTWIDYRGGPGTFRAISARDVLGGRVSPRAFRDKVVVIGVTARAAADLHRTPFDKHRLTSGAEVQANAISTLARRASLRDVSRWTDALLIAL